MPVSQLCGVYILVLALPLRRAEIDNEAISPSTALWINTIFTAEQVDYGIPGLGAISKIDQIVDK